MKPRLAEISLISFGIAVILWILLTVFEAALVGMSAGAERILIFLLLVAPAGVGAILAVLSLIRREDRTWLAIASILLNGLFGLFHMLILLFAG
jgi:hypothetical protein